MNRHYYYNIRPYRGRGYGLSNLIGDVTLSIATGGLWAVWWIIREVRS